MLVDSKKIFEIARSRKFAIPATNFVDQNTVSTYVKVAEKLNNPIIIAFAQAHDSILPLEEAYLLGEYYARTASVPVILHLDHGEDVEYVKQAIDLGFKSVMIDASEDILKENIRKTQEIVQYGKEYNVRVEAEIGHVGAGQNYENHEIKLSQYTSVEDAINFVEATNVDTLAISIGTAHGLYTGTPKIDFELLEEIRKVIDTPLVLHGGSSSGFENLSRCAQNGIVKINVFTDLVTAAVNNIKIIETDYIDLQNQMKIGLEDCLTEYYRVFGTQPI